MQKQRYNLIELAIDLDTSEAELISYGADDELTLYVIADKWPGKKAGNPDAESDVIVDGEVDLLPSDLLKAMGADHTKIRKVRTRDGDIVALDPTQERMPGRQYVTTAERDRLKEALKPTPQPTVAAFKDALPPYLDPSHDYYSETLDAAIRAASAQYVEGGFKPKSLGHIEQLEIWLRKHYPKLSVDARERIAKVVNPNKKGGNPLTKK